MKMKRLFFVLFVILIGVVFYGCSDDGDYYWELFRVLENNYNSEAKPAGNFTAVKDYRDRLYTYNVEDIGSGTDLTQGDLQKLLKDRGMPTKDINESIAFLNSERNNVFVFRYALDNIHLVIMYVEKL